MIFGMGLYSLGTDVSIQPMGGHVGSRITKTRKLWLILLVCFIIGVIVTVAEPDLTVLATQVPGIENSVLITAVALGVGVFIVLAILRIALKVKLSYVLVAFYTILFVLAAVVATKDESFIPLAFDAGGVTTGPITVPFIMSLGIGISAVMGGKNSEDNSFGVIGICSIGPILAVLILGLAGNPQSSASPETVTEFTSLGEVFKNYLQAFPHYLKEVGIALAPILVFFLVFQLIALRLPKLTLGKLLIGLIYTYIGLSLFLTGVNIGFMPAGLYIGGKLAAVSRWLPLPVGIVVGAFIVLAEPAVHVLVKQVEEISGGAIGRKTMMIILALSMAAALGLSMLRVATGISIWYVIAPGYAIALGLSFFVPKIFTAVAFDSGGVASGPMTAAFLLPFAMGAVTSVGGNILTDAFGIVAVVAMTPLITVQIAGLAFKIKQAKSKRAVSAAAERLLAAEGVVIDLTQPYIPAKTPAAAKKGRKKSGKKS